jgi:hypothetical protein
MKLKLKKGALHKEMGVPQGQKIPAAGLQKEKAKGGLAAKRAQFAINAKKWNPKGGSSKVKSGLAKAFPPS